MAVPAIGAQGQLIVEPGASPHTFDSSSERYEIISESMQAVTPTVERDGFRGVRSLPKQTIKRGAKSVGGTIVLNPSPADLDLWLPRIMRLAGSGDTFALGDSTTAADIKFGIMIDRVTDVFAYSDCQVSRATFRGAPGQLLELRLDIIGLNETCNNVDGSVSWPSPAPTWSTAANTAPYIYHEGALALTAHANADDPLDFAIVIDNVLQPRFPFSQTATELSPADRIVTVTMSVPYDTDHDDLYRQSEKTTPNGGTITFTNGTLSTTFTFAHLQGGDASPTLNTKGELVLSVPFRARASGTQTTPGVYDQDELTITNDATA